MKYFQEGNYERAKMLVGNAISLWQIELHFLNNVMRNDQVQPGVKEAHEKQVNKQLLDAYVNFGNVLHRMGSANDAIKCFEHAIQLDESCASAYSNIAHVLNGLRKRDKALKYIKKAVELAPDNALYQQNLSSLYGSIYQFEQAKEAGKRAVELEPDNIEYKMLLCYAYYNTDDFEAAKKLEKEIFSNPESDKYIVDTLKANVYRTLPKILTNRNTIKETRKEISDTLDELLSRDDLDIRLRFVSFSGFYLAYHNLNNKDLFMKHAQLFRKTCPELTYVAPHCQKPLQEKKVRKIGFITQYLHEHSIMRCYSGIIGRFSRYDEFEAYIISCSSTADGRYKDTFKYCKYIQIPQALDTAQEIIAEAELDILIYLDIGMEHFLYHLAFARLAPIQCVVGGHPDTTGVNTIDYYFSSEDLECENAQDHYSETLVKFKEIPLYYLKPDIPEKFESAETLNLPKDVNLYVCPMMLQKIHPDFDDALAKIIEKDKDARIILFKVNDRNYHEPLIDRMEKSYPGIKKKILLFPFVDMLTFQNILHHAHAVLDTFHFGGGTTLYITFALGVPVISLPGKFSRSRTAYALYKKMGIMDLIAKDADNYVELAVKLANDRTFYKKISEQILKQNHLLYESEAAAEEMKAFFLETEPGLKTVQAKTMEDA